MEHILEAMKSACDIVGAFQLKHWNQVLAHEVEIKSQNQLVSFVDQESEKILFETLVNALPGSTIIGEESAPDNRHLSEFTWIIDPLDGTTNYLHGLPIFSISVALLHHGDPILALVDCPVLQERFTAQKGKGAWLNGTKISVAQNHKLQDSLIATGFPYHEFREMEPYIEVLQKLMKETRGLRRMGSAAIDLAYTACGRFDGFFELNLSPWDIAAGILLVREAGGVVSDFKGGEELIFGTQILAGSQLVYPQLQGIIGNSFK
jgi:myo-inositol-1(or 4)-monophosphatase